MRQTAFTADQLLALPRGRHRYGATLVTCDSVLAVSPGGRAEVEVVE